MKPKTVPSPIVPKNKKSAAANRAARVKAAAVSPIQPAPAPLAPPKPVAVAAPVPPARPVQPVPPAPATTITAKIDVGFGNALFIRGQGNGLSWDKGTPMQCVDSSTWTYSAPRSSGNLLFKVLLNDEVWAQGEDLTATAGQAAEFVPVL